MPLWHARLVDLDRSGATDDARVGSALGAAGPGRALGAAAGAGAGWALGAAAGAGVGWALGAAAGRYLAGLGHVAIQPGLTGTELDRIEQRFGCTFAEDHRAFLATVLPVGTGWPDWRDGDPDVLSETLDWPIEGVLLDVERNGFWWPSWGQRPATAPLAVARRHLLAAPRMVPVHSHRYLPAERSSFGHPVLSMYQTDISCVAEDLLRFVQYEFGPVDRRPAAGRPADAVATVSFWRDLVA